MLIVAKPSVAGVEYLNYPDVVPDWFKLDVVPWLWLEAEARGVDPLGVIAQSLKETGNGLFTGKVKREFRNTCGLKVSSAMQKLYPGVTDNDNPLAHQTFATWVMGARAQVQHLLAYAGVWTDNEALVDPRWALAFKEPGIDHFEELNGKWAGPNYGTEVVNIANRLRGN